MTNLALAAHDVCFSYACDIDAPGATPLLEDISLALEPGRVVCIVGPNGAGKSTLLNICAGLLKPQRGGVTLDGLPLETFSRREIARRIAVIPPEAQAPFDYTVDEVVEMGRTPYANSFRPLAAYDHAVIDQSLARTGLADFSSRIYNHLSSGERQRVVIARALAQEPQCLLMDEPTVHLDIHYQVEIHSLMRQMASDGLAVLVISHDLNLASQYCDRLVLMEHGRVVRSGTPMEVLDAELLSRIYRTPLDVFPHLKTDRPTVWPRT